MAEPSTSGDFANLVMFLAKVLAIGDSAKNAGHGRYDNGNWWVKFIIDIEHPLGWSTVQEFGYVPNSLSLDERLSTRFLPVSPPPYLNGGPEFLSWVIEGTDPQITPDEAANWLVERLPKPVEDPSRWPINDSES